MRRLTVTRNKGYYGRLRKLALLVDSVHVAYIKPGETIEISVADDASVLMGKMDWGKTEEFPLENLPDGQQISVNAYFSFNPLRSMGLMAIPITFSLG